MSNKGPKLTKARKRSKETAKPKKHTVLGSLLVVATLLGGIAAVVVFWPRVVATISDPVDPDDPFSASATVTNTGYIPLDSVTPYVGVASIRTKGSPPASEDFETYPPQTTKFRRAQWPTRTLGLDDKFTFALNDVVDTHPGQLESAAIAVVVDYEIPIIHWQREKIFPFAAHRQTNGKFYWYSKTVR